MLFEKIDERKSKPLFLFQVRNNVKEDIKPPKVHSNAFKYLQIYMEFAFFTLIFPFRLQKAEDGTLKLKVFPVQKYLCLICYILSWVQRICEVRMTLPRLRPIEEDPGQLWSLAGMLVDGVEKVVLTLIAWNRPFSQKILKLAITSHSLMKTEDNTFRNTELIFVTLAFLLFIILTLLDASITYIWPLISVYFMVEPANRAVLLLDVFPICVTLKCFHELNYRASDLDASVPTWFLYLMHTLSTWSYIWKIGCSISTILLSYLFSFMIFRVARDFQKFLKALKEQDGSFDQAVEGYMTVKLFVSCLNACGGGVALTGVLRALAGLSAGIVRVLLNAPMDDTLQILHQFVVFICILVLSAEANSKLEMFYEYLVANRKEPTFQKNSDQVIILMNDLNRGDFGIKAFTFTISYSFIATVCSTFLTYIIIILQFQSSKKNLTPILL